MSNRSRPMQTNLFLEPQRRVRRSSRPKFGALPDFNEPKSRLPYLNRRRGVNVYQPVSF